MHISSLDEKDRIENGTIDLRFNLRGKYWNETLAGRRWLISPATKKLDYVVVYDRIAQATFFCSSSSFAPLTRSGSLIPH